MKFGRLSIPGSQPDAQPIPIAIDHSGDSVRPGSRCTGRILPGGGTYAGGGVDGGGVDLSALPEVTFAVEDLLPPAAAPEATAGGGMGGRMVASTQKIFCVGLNYREHIEEMGHPIPDHPTLFTKFPDTLTRPFATVEVPVAMAEQVDYEGELAIIMGDGGRIAGYAVANDFSQRDWQYRTQQWMQGKNVVASSALGPWMVTADELDPVAEGCVLRTWVNGELRQEHSLADLVFKPQELVDYIQTFTPLRAGDVIMTGTPEGVGHGMKPPRYLADGDEVTVGIDGIGSVTSVVRFEG